MTRCKRFSAWPPVRLSRSALPSHQKAGEPWNTAFMLENSSGAVSVSTFSLASNCMTIGRNATPSAARKNSRQRSASTTKAMAREVGSVTLSLFSPSAGRPGKQKPPSVEGGPAGLLDSSASSSNPMSVAFQRKARARILPALATSRGEPMAAAA